MRDRLVELILNAERDFANSGKPVLDIEKYVADHLLANGVIVPTCKLGDTIYRIGDNGKIYGDWEITFIQAYPEEIVYFDDSDNYFVESDIGKTVFLTREEAEKALRKEDEGK